mmetsp:Transcript_43369/g.114720  ORF Transcript_43369/g.114720 Transcript_43369/m.114720 type:complete len:347 (+) Transcript_43369:110-1150(+)
MGCGLVAQRGVAVVEAHHPLAQDGHARTRIHGIRAPTGGEGVDSSSDAAPHSPDSPVSSGGTRESHAAREGEHGSRQGSARGERDPEARSGSGSARGGVPRRFALGERALTSSRPPGNVQDHAFCFECGIFFPLSSERAPQCARCGSSFIQFLRGQATQNWISAHSDTGMSHTFEDQLDNSITASMDEAPAQRKPTQGTFLRGLLSICLTEDEQVEARASYGAADPRCTCSICRDVFEVGATLKQMPCHHEFHETCIITWLGTNNTCPICRWRCPEAVEGEEEEEEDVLRIKPQDGSTECGDEVADRQAQGLPILSSEEDEETQEGRQNVDRGGGVAMSPEVSGPA